MAAKTQDAAGVLVRNNERVHYQPDANPGDRWMVTRDGEPRLWAESLYVIAQHLNLDVEEFNRCAALMEPATPRETALAAQRETATVRHRKRGLTPEMVEAHYPTSQYQFDECETCRAIHDIAKEALAAPTGEAGVPWSSAMPFEWSDPGSPLTELRMWYDHAVLKAEAARRTGKYPLLLADKDRAFAAMLAAARVPAPSAPQEPRGEPGEGMVERAWLSECERDPRLKTVDAKSVAGEKAAIRSILRAALSSEAPDAD